MMVASYKNIKKIIFLLFIILVLFFLYKLFPLFSDDKIGDEKSKKDKLSNKRVEEHERVEKRIEDYFSIIDRNIFDSQNRPTEAPPMEDSLAFKEPELLPLSATLLGTIVNKNPEKSLAMVNMNGKTKSYKIGDSLDGISRITRIERQFIEVDRNGNLSEIRKDQDGGRSPRFGGSTIFGQEASDEVTESGATVSKESISNVFKDGDIFGQIMSLMPNTEGEGVRGFKIMQVSPGDIYSVLGLKNGDILLSANGQVIDNIDLLITFLQDLPQKKSFDIVIQRAGKSQKLSYKVK